MSKPGVGTNVGVEKNHDRTGNRRLAFETVASHFNDWAEQDSKFYAVRLHILRGCIQ